MAILWRKRLLHGIFMQTLNNVVPDVPPSDGIFTAIEKLNPPWSGVVAPHVLDYQYHGNHSGSKPISPLAGKMLLDNGTLNLAGMATVIYGMFQKQWEHLWDSYALPKYNLFDSVDLTEEETRDLTGTEVGTESTSGESHDKTKTAGTDTSTEDTTNTDTTNTTVSHTNAIDSNRNGFNSSDVKGVPVNNTQQTENTTTEETVSSVGKDTYSGTNSSTEDIDRTKTESFDRDKTTTDTGKITRTRKGLSGYRSKQDLIESDRKLWLDNYFSIIMKDVDSVLCLPVYDLCKLQ